MTNILLALILLALLPITGIACAAALQMRGVSLRALSVDVRSLWIKRRKPVRPKGI